MVLQNSEPAVNSVVKILVSIALLSHALAGNWLNGQLVKDTGTLIVTYQTGPKGERLDRIRFNLIDNKHQCQMFPKQGAFVDDPFCLNRMVVIEDLPAGDYIVEFLIPNWDNFFEAVSPRHVIIFKDKVTKIDQVIKLNGH